MKLFDSVIGRHSGAGPGNQAANKLAERIRDAKPQRFYLDDNVVAACEQVSQSKPESLLSAFAFARLPYASTWLEWHRPKVPESAAHQFGVLLTDASGEAGPRDGSAAIATLVLRAGHLTVIAPFWILLDWSQELKFLDRYKQMDLGGEPQSGAERELRHRQGIIPNQQFRSYWEDGHYPLLTKEDVYTWDTAHLTEEQRAEIDDMAYAASHPAWLVTGFLVMLNSRSILECQREDLRALNKSREKKGKPPLASGFIHTRLRIPKHVSSAFGNSASERAAARLHVVRGHFKVRKTGVFWWTPHPRGAGRSEVKRQEYRVGGSS